MGLSYLNREYGKAGEESHKVYDEAYYGSPAHSFERGLRGAQVFPGVSDEFLRYSVSVIQDGEYGNQVENLQNEPRRQQS